MGKVKNSTLRKTNGRNIDAEKREEQKQKRAAAVAKNKNR